MPAQFSTGKRQSAASPSSLSPTPKQTISRTIPQARLDMIANPSWAWNRENCRWQARYAHQAEWSVEELTERRGRLRQDIETLETLVTHPPEDWDGIFWTQMYERLQGWKGHLNAIDRALDNRGRATSRPSGSTWKVGSTASTAPAAVLDSSTDPFQWE